MKAKVFTVVAVILLVALGVGAFFWLWKPESSDPEPEYVFSTPDVQTSQSPDEPDETERSYAVSSSSDIATEVGMSVLKAGGNAVDAGIAIGYTLSVVEPYASGLGGSGGLLVYDMNTKECVFYDYRAAGGTNGGAVGVPGFVAGMEACHDDYGSMPMADLINPAIYYAENGFTINTQLGRRLHIARDDLDRYSWLYNENGNYLSAGDTLYQNDLAETLRTLQTGGAEVFYTGSIADDIVAKCSLTKEDLANYQVYKKDALQGYFEGYTVYSANAPLSGVTMIQMLELADELDIVNPSDDPLTYLSQLKQITATAYGDRYSTIGDHDFYEFDENELVSPEYIKALIAAGYSDKDYDKDNESPETTSYTVVDANGLVVTATNTLTKFWGSRVVADGIFLNSTNDNFSSSGINKFEAGKRSRTYTAPTIITGSDGYVLAIGTPGGNNIPSRLFAVIVDILKFGTDPQEAVKKAGILYRNGVLMMEPFEEEDRWFDTSGVRESIVWKNDETWWGSVSLCGFTQDKKAFSAFDTRRGASKAGLYNPE